MITRKRSIETKCHVEMATECRISTANSEHSNDRTSGVRKECPSEKNGKFVNGKRKIQASAVEASRPVGCNGLDAQPAVDWCVGDLVWGHLGRYPFWPAMIMYDPEDGKFNKTSVFRNAQISRKYHVHFFGDSGKRAWLNSQSLMEFNGRDHFLKLCTTVLKQSKKRDPKYISRYKVQQGILGKWEMAVKQAEASVTKTRYERVDLFNQEYPVMEYRVQKIVSSSSMTSNSQERPAKKQQTNSCESQMRNSLKGFKSGRACQVCMQPCKRHEYIQCEGICHSVYHLECLRLKDHPEGDFKCSQCISGKHPCFICNKYDGTVQCCSVQDCGKYYHEYCIKTVPQAWFDEGSFTCSLHVCHTCTSDDPREARMRMAKHLVKCIQCPTSYHTGDHCLPAGSLMLSSSQIICPKHFKPAKVKQHPSVSWCFLCGNGGSLIICDNCPATFHLECLKISAPEGNFYCDDCASGRFPLYGEIVWAKFRTHRWWPAKIIFPSEVPQNLKNSVHSQGDFVVYFFGDGTYGWVNQGTVYLYQQGDAKSQHVHKESRFGIALQQAEVALEQWKKKKASAGASKSKEKPPPYVKIKTNKPVPPVRLCKVSLPSACECDPDSENPCGPDSGCVNRNLLIECHSSICEAKQKCCNQHFQKREYATLEPYRTEGRGWGLRTRTDVKQDDFVIEYVGELIDDKEFHRRMEKKQLLKEENYYFLTISKGYTLDSEHKGNLARFVNHSCDPNCETRKWTVNNETRIGLFCIQDIPKGMEVTINYNLINLGDSKKPCLCGAANCSGFIGAKTKYFQILKDKSNCNNKKKRIPKASHECCYQCDEGGKLVSCKVNLCDRKFHLRCQKQNRKDARKFLCNLHQCYGSQPSVSMPLLPQFFR